MKKVFTQFSILLVLFTFTLLLLSCFGSDSKDDAPPAYMSKSHILLMNTSDTRHITSLKVATDEFLHTPLSPGYFLHLYSSDEGVGLNISFVDDKLPTPQTFSYSNQNIPIGKVLYFEYNGSSTPYTELADASKFANFLIENKSKSINTSSGMEMESVIESLDEE
jgi:hypothetical protein